jgi:integrase
MTLQHALTIYLQQRLKDAHAGLIVIERYKVLCQHLKHLAAYLSPDTALAPITAERLQGYTQHRQQHSKRALKASTLNREHTTIKAFMRWCKQQGYTTLDAHTLRFAKGITADNDSTSTNQRATFTHAEYVAFCWALRQYCSPRHKQRLGSEAWRKRQVLKYLYLILASTGMRTGELRQLQWRDVELVQYSITQCDEHGQHYNSLRCMAKLTIRASTSKVRSSRIVYCREGHYFAQLQKYTHSHDPKAWVFQLGDGQLIDRSMLTWYFHRILRYTDKIPKAKKQRLVPYSLRHYMMTQRIKQGIRAEDVAKMCGTSIGQIENTYYHLHDSEQLAYASQTGQAKVVKVERV